jgi:hypothetical protein
MRKRSFEGGSEIGDGICLRKSGAVRWRWLSAQGPTSVTAGREVRLLGCWQAFGWRGAS